MANEKVRIYIWQSEADGKFYPSFIGRNGKNLNPEGYNRVRYCIQTVELLRKYLPTAPIIFEKPPSSRSSKKK